MKGGGLSGNASSAIGTAAPEAPEKRGERECGSNRHREYFNAFWVEDFAGIAEVFARRPGEGSAEARGNMNIS
jgi:hypothetical protein